MTTGAEVLKITLAKIDKFYSKYLDPIKWNRIFRMALVNVSEKKYMGFTTQKELDELRFAIKANQVFPVRNSKISITPLIITDIVASSGSLTITTLTDHNLVVNDTVTVSGALGITTVPDVNGTFVITSVNNTNQFEVNVSFSSGTYTPNTGSLTHPQMIADYYHLLTVRCKTSQPFRNLMVSEVINRTPAIVVFNRHNNIATGDQIVISNHPNASVNGTWYYESINDIKGRLWQNSALTVPVLCTASTTVGGNINRVYYDYAEPLYSDRKISDFEYLGQYDNPKVETSDGILTFYPDTSEIIIDYYSKPTTYIDVMDNILDLESVYPMKFIYRIIDEAILIYSIPSRDALLEQMVAREATP